MRSVPMPSGSPPPPSGACPKPPKRTIADLVQAPPLQPPDRQIHPLRLRVHAVPPRQIPPVEARLRGTSRHRRRIHWRYCREKILPAPHPCVTAAAAHSGGTRRKEQVPVGIHKPPPPVHLLHPEKARRPGLGVQIPAVFAVAEPALTQARFLSRPLILKLIQALHRSEEHTSELQS